METAIPPQSFPRQASRFELAGPAGALEVASTWPSAARHAGVAVICHPHPLYGGTMDNKVVTTLEKTYGDLGLPTLRFNFRGVGRSAGVHDHANGEREDLATVVAFARAALPDCALWLAGFSFGSFVAAASAARLQPAHLLGIAPPVSSWPFAQLPMPPCPWLVVQGEQDEVVPPQDVYDWIAAMPDPPTLIRMPGTSHFFHGQLMPLRQLLDHALRPLLPPLVQ